MKQARSQRFIVLILAGLIVLVAMVYVFRNNLQRRFLGPTGSTLQQGVTSNSNHAEIDVITQNLTVPWEIAFLPDGDLLVTERSGTLKRIGRNNHSYVIEGVQHTSEGGLLGVALHPDFRDNGLIYVYLTTRSGEGLVNRVERYRYKDDNLSERADVITGIPGASNHDGGRIAFGPDKKLYITTGDAGRETQAQDKNSLAGKILRLNDDGSIPANNPFGNAVYSYGHRNPQGLAWDGKGQLWSSEHGRSGASSGFDEVNLINRGGNYGWPNIEGDETREGMIGPAVHSGGRETWAPASLAYMDGSLFFGGLRGESLYEAKIGSNNELSLKAHLKSDYGRLRAVAAGPENWLYISTSNTDGRGNINPNDDKIIRINSQIFRR